MDNYDDSNLQQLPTPSGINKVFKSILSCPGRIVSFSLLNTRGVFRRHCVEDITGRELMHHIADKMPDVGVGIIETFVIPGNKTHVSCWVKLNCSHNLYYSLFQSYFHNLRSPSQYYMALIHTRHNYFPDRSFFCQARSARGPMSGPRFCKKASTTWYVTASLSGTFHAGKWRKISYLAYICSCYYSFWKAIPLCLQPQC